MGPSAVDLLLVRHGETDFNAEGRLQGADPPGPPLNARGRAQAEQLAAALAAWGARFDAVYSSDLLRATQTADVIASALGVPRSAVFQRAGLKERDVGSHLAGLTRAEAPSKAPAAWAALSCGDAAAAIPGGGESIEGLQARIAGALEEVAARHPGQRLLVVIHGGALHAVHRRARGYMAPGRVANCAAARLRIDPGAGGQARARQERQQRRQQQHKHDHQQQQQAHQQEQHDHHQQQQQQQQERNGAVEEESRGGSGAPPVSSGAPSAPQQAGSCSGGGVGAQPSSGPQKAAAPAAARPAAWALLSWNEVLAQGGGPEGGGAAAAAASFGGGAREG